MFAFRHKQFPFMSPSLPTWKSAMRSRLQEKPALLWLVTCLPLFFGAETAKADWPALHGNAQHTGYIDANITPPFRVAWARFLTGERLGTAMEPIVAD